MIIEFKNAKKTENGECAISKVVSTLGIRTARGYFDIATMPENVPIDVNPRKNHIDSEVTDAIEKSLSEGNPLFMEMNRGLLIICEDVKIDEDKNSVTVKVNNDPYEGIADGGHTYRCIVKYLQSLKTSSIPIKKDKMYVPIEFVWGDAESRQKYALLISIARNTAKQVSDIAIANKLGKFDMLNKFWYGQPWSFRVVYEESRTAELGIGKILQILNIFNMDNCKAKDGSFNPKSAINSKDGCNKSYETLYDAYGETTRNPYYAMRNIIIDIFNLYDFIESRIPELAINKLKIDWNSFESGNGRGRKKFGEITKDRKTLFYDNKKLYYCPRVFVKPMLSVLRPLIGLDDDGFYKWNTDPFNFFERYGAEFVKILCEYYSNDGNHSPSETAKNCSMWNDLYKKSIESIENDRK